MARNEHTGDKQQTRAPSEEYLANWDKIFGKKVRDNLIENTKLLNETPITDYLTKDR